MREVLGLAPDILPTAQSAFSKDLSGGKPSSMSDDPSKPEISSEPQRRLGIAPIVMAALALGSLALLGLADFGKLDAGIESNQESLSNSTGTGDVLAQDPEEAGILSDSTKDLMLECTRGINSLRGVLNRLDFTTLDEYLEKAVINVADHHQHRITQLSHQIDLVESHGRHLRLVLKPESSPKDHAMVMKGEVFEIPAHEKPRLLSRISGPQASPAALEVFKQRGQVLADESSEVRRWDEAVGARVMRRNGHVQRYARVFPGRGLELRARHAPTSYLQLFALKSRLKT